MSIAFDQAVAYYDRTRALPPEAHQRFVAQVVAELAGRPTLEIGVGTGRIGLSLADAGVPIVGLDLSRPMLDVLRSKGSLPVVQGDCVRLPYADRSFGGAVAAMVLHLVPEYPAALAELARVVRPGGVVLAARGGADALWNETAGRFYAALGGEAKIVGARTIEHVDEAAAALGFGVRALPSVTWPATFVAEDYIAQHEARQFAPLWSVPEEDCRRAAAETRRWAAERFGGPVATESSATWHAYDLPADA